MKPKFPIAAVAVLLLTMAVSAWQSIRVEHLREADAFYQWMLGAATSDRLFQEDQGDDHADLDLMKQVIAVTDSALPEIPPPADGDAPSNKLAAAVQHGGYDEAIWELASGEALADARNSFLDLAHAGKLQFANKIQYAEISGADVSVFNMFFGFRKVAANFVWLQVDRFWHQGMMQRMIPLMKTCVILDPNFIDAYLLGAWHLGYNATANMDDTPQPMKIWNDKYQVCMGEKQHFYYESVEYLKDGIRNNPRNYKLYFDLGFGLYKEKLNDYDNAVKYLGEAVRQPHERWVPRQLYICMGLAGQYEAAMLGWKDYLSKFPDNEVAPRFIIRNEAMLWDARANAAYDQANETADPAEKARLKNEGDEALAKTRELWASLDDVYASARLRMLDAVVMGEEGRYLEAIAMLDHARWEIGSVFVEASNMIIKYKQRGGINLSKSEAMEVLRRKEGDACIGSPAGYVEKRAKDSQEE